MVERIMVEVSERGVRIVLEGPQGGYKGGLLLPVEECEGLITRLQRGVAAVRVLRGEMPLLALPAETGGEGQ
jgi:hypothetical protein